MIKSQISKLSNKLVAFFFGEKYTIKKDEPVLLSGKIPLRKPPDNYGTLKGIFTGINNDYSKSIEYSEQLPKSKFIDMRNFPPPPDSRRVRDIKQMLTLIDSLSEDLQKAQWKVISECAEKYSRLTPFEESNPANKTN